MVDAGAIKSIECCIRLSEERSKLENTAFLGMLALSKSFFSSLHRLFRHHWVECQQLTRKVNHHECFDRGLVEDTELKILSAVSNFQLRRVSPRSSTWCEIFS